MRRTRRDWTRRRFPRGGSRVPVKRSQVEDSSSVAERDGQIRKQTEAFLAELDRNGDGVVLRDEVPLAFRRFGFRRIDHNGDGRLERSEIETAAAERL